MKEGFNKDVARHILFSLSVRDIMRVGKVSKWHHGVVQKMWVGLVMRDFGILVHSRDARMVYIDEHFFLPFATENVEKAMKVGVKRNCIGHVRCGLRREVYPQSVLHEAVRYNRPRIVKLMLDYCPPTEDTLQLAIIANRTRSLGVLLNDPRVVVTVSELRTAAANSQALTVKCMISKCAPDTSVINAEIQHGRKDVVELLLKDGRATPTCMSRNYDKACLLLKDRRAPVTREVFCDKLQWGDERVAGLLVEYKRVTPTDEDLLTAVQHNRPTVVRMLLRDGRVDPNVAVSTAVEARHGLIMAALLSDERTRVSGVQLRSAACGGNRVITKLIVERDLAFDRLALKEAVKHSWVEIVLRMLDHPECGPEDKQLAIVGAGIEGLWYIVHHLLDHVDLSDPNIVVGPATCGHTDITLKLLSDDRFAEFDCTQLLPAAVGNRDIALLRFLVLNEKVDPSVADNAILKVAIMCGDIPFIKHLMHNDKVANKIPTLLFYCFSVPWPFWRPKRTCAD